MNRPWRTLRCHRFTKRTKRLPDSDTRADFITFMGRTLESLGLPPIAGRILGLLIFDGEPRSFSELATELGVSRGSISANSRHLVARGAIVKENRPGDRQDYFSLSEESHEVMLQDLSAQFLDYAESVKGFADILPAGEGARTRLDRLAKFYAAMGEGVARASDSLRRP